MLFLLFQIGSDRYALEARKVVQVLPLLSIKRLPQAPRGVAGVFVFRGTPVPAVDLSELTISQPARHLLSTRIILVNYSRPGGEDHLLGLIAEKATDVLRKEPQDFINSGINIKAAPYLGPVLRDPKGPIQWLHEQQLLTGPVERLLFSSSALMNSSLSTPT
jgi:chemotaxis-related protein WspB